MNANIFEKANQIIQKCDTAYIGTINEDGYPSVSTISIIHPENIFGVYFSTNADGNKARRLQKNKAVSICFRTDEGNITLVGDATIITDQETKNNYWLGWFIDHYPKGKTDPNFVVIQFVTKHASLWIENEGASFCISDLLTIQSRCGLLCNSCTFKEPFHCGGCIPTNGHPFHGECPIAICCQNKGYTHCGECALMPCHKLLAYSCGDDEHCDNPKGARISVCNAWKTKGFINSLSNTVANPS